jgi:acyl-CoA thioester hydrolase
MSPLKLELRIDWSEMDLFGHVNNIAFMKYVQAARVNYWEQIGLTQMHARENHGPMLASSSCVFLKPLFYPGRVRIETKLEFIKTASFGLHHKLHNDKGELVAEAHDVVVMYNFNTQLKMEIPKQIRDAMDRAETKTA